MLVRKAVIPAAGLGTRLLPASKSVPKELLPVVDRPMLHYVVAEAMAAGITQFVIVTSRGKEALASYFEHAHELAAGLQEKRARDAMAELHRIAEAAEFVFVYQEEQLGLGHAVLTAREAVGDEPFAVLLPDDLIVSAEPAIGQVLQVALRYNSSVVATQEVPQDKISAYGIITPSPVGPDTYEVLDLVEKPSVEQAASNLGILGRYVLTPQVFEELAKVRPGAIGELQLTDGIAALLQHQKVYAQVLHGKRYDIGTPVGLLQASLELALQREEFAPSMRAWLEQLAIHPEHSRRGEQ